MATWSLAGRHAGPDKHPTPVFINLDNVLTIERQNDLTMVTMVGGEQVYIDTIPETLIGTVAPRVPCSSQKQYSMSRLITRDGVARSRTFAP
jgi:hypothetical protein